MSARASLIPRACLAALAAREHTARLVACAGGRAPVAERTRSRYTDRARLAAARRPRMHTRMHTRARACEKRLRSRAPRAMPTRSHDRSQRSSYDRRNVVAYRHRRNHTRQSMSIKSRTVRTVKLFRVGLAFCFVHVRPHTTVNGPRARGRGRVWRNPNRARVAHLGRGVARLGGPGGASRARGGPLSASRHCRVHPSRDFYYKKMLNGRSLFVPVPESRTTLVPTPITPTPLLSTLVNPGLKRMRSGRTAPSARSRSPCPPWRPCWQLG